MTNIFCIFSLQSLSLFFLFSIHPSTHLYKDKFLDKQPFLFRRKYLSGGKYGVLNKSLNGIKKILDQHICVFQESNISNAKLIGNQVNFFANYDIFDHINFSCILLGLSLSTREFKVFEFFGALYGFGVVRRSQQSLVVQREVMELTSGLVVDKASILEMIVLQSPTLNEPFKVKEPESRLP